MYSPQLHQDIARHRQADMRREADRRRLAAIAAGEKRRGPSTLGRIGSLLSQITVRRRIRLVGGQPAVDSTA